MDFESVSEELSTVNETGLSQVSRLAQMQLRLQQKVALLESELNDAKKNITGQFPIKTASNTAKLKYLELIGFYDMPFDYLDKFNQKINNISKQDIIKTFNKYIKLESFARIAVGNSKDLLNEANNS